MSFFWPLNVLKFTYYKLRQDAADTHKFFKNVTAILRAGLPITIPLRAFYNLREERGAEGRGEDEEGKEEREGRIPARSPVRSPERGVRGRSRPGIIYI